jgi:hypothetical protein
MEEEMSRDDDDGSQKKTSTIPEVEVHLKEKLKQKEMEEEINRDDDDGSQKKTSTIPEVEVHLYVRGEGPIHVFKTPLGGWDQDRLDLQQIMDDYGLKALYAYGARSGRGLRLRLNPRNGLSMLPYTGNLVCLDGEPKDSWLKPISKILMVLALVTLLVVMILREPPQWIHKLKFIGGGSLPWTATIIVIVISRLRKKVRNLLRSYGLW